MSKKYLVPIDMNGLEIQNFLAHNLATAPTGSDGKIYFNTVDHKLYYYNGTSWVPLTEGAIYTGTSPISVSGTTISHANSGVTAASKGDTSNQTPGFGSTFKVPSGTVDAKGHLTAFADHTVKIPNATATTSAAGLMSSDDKTKLNGVATGAEVNQNAFSNVKVGSTTVAADSKTDTLELVAGSNVTITPDATNDKITIAATSSISDVKAFKETTVGVQSEVSIVTNGVATIPCATEQWYGGVKIMDDTYNGVTIGTVDGNEYAEWNLAGLDENGKLLPSHLPVATTSQNGAMSSSDKSKLDGIASGAQVNQNAFSNVKVGSTTVAADSKTDTLELVAGSNVTLTPDATNDKVTIAATDTTYSEATTSAAGLMSSSDKTKLNGIATGAEVNQNAFSNVKVGSTTVAADGKTDTLELVAGSNITLTPDATNDKVTIAATDTTYASGTTALIEAGTNTTDSVWTPKILHDYIASAIGGVDAMRFKGTIGTGGTVTSLPTSGVKVGDTYRVITAGTYASQTCEVGDLIIATATTPTWTVAQTNIDGAITSISGTSPISVTGSGNSRTIAHDTSGVTAGSYSGTHQNIGYYMPSVTVDSTGHVTSAANLGTYIPNNYGTNGGDIVLNDGSWSRALREYNRDITATTSKLAAGDTTKTITISEDSESAYTFKTYFRVADVQAFDATTFEPLVVDWSVDKLASNGSSITLTVSIASAYTHDICLNPILSTSNSFM